MVRPSMDVIPDVCSGDDLIVEQDHVPSLKVQRHVSVGSNIRWVRLGD
jgi:hypothetical protein